MLINVLFPHEGDDALGRMGAALKQALEKETTPMISSHQVAALIKLAALEPGMVISTIRFDGMNLVLVEDSDPQDKTTYIIDMTGKVDRCSEWMSRYRAGKAEWQRKLEKAPWR